MLTVSRASTIPVQGQLSERVQFAWTLHETLKAVLGIACVVSRDGCAIVSVRQMPGMTNKCLDIEQ